MESAANKLRQIRLFVTDADGTVMGRRPEFEQFRVFRARINSLRDAYAARWVVCTGRSLRGYKAIFRPMNVFGIKPDYVIARHAYIYECRPWGFLPHWLWNLRVLWLQFREDLAVRRILPRMRRVLLSRNPFAIVTHSGRDRLCFRFEDEGAAHFGAEILRAEARASRYLQVFQSPGEVDVRVVPFTKGLAVRELARRVNVANGQILVVGDGHNDISMMEMEPPCRTACPANAAPEVIEVVHRTGGHIASDRSLGGVIEVLNAYETGMVNSRLPEGWGGHERSPHGPHRSRGISGIGTFIVLGLVLYTTLLVLCSFCNVPGRHLVLKPYVKLVEAISRVVQSPGK